MRIEKLTQLKELLKEAETEQEIAEISSIIEEAKGKLYLEEKKPGFWAGKTACWEMFACPPEVRNECPAPKYRSYPCWEIEGTYCKLSEYGMKGDGTQICKSCRVYKKWGHGEPIEIKLLGKGFNPAAIAVGEEEREMIEEHANIRTEQWREGDKVEVKSSGSEMYSGTVSLNTKTNPKQVEFKINQCSMAEYVGETSLGIYKLDENKLTIAASEPGSMMRYSGWIISAVDGPARTSP